MPRTAARARLFPCFPRLAAALLVAAALAASGSSRAPAAEPDDPALAERLLEKGWLDVAERLFQELARNGATPAARARGELGLIEVLRKKAEAEPDPARKKALYDEAIRRYRERLGGHGPAFADSRALQGMAELLRARGDDLAASARREKQPEARAALSGAAVAAYEEAIALLEKPCREGLEALKREGGGPESLPEPQCGEFRDALFARADFHLAAAKAVEGDEAKRDRLLREADRLFEEFIWIWEDETALAWVATIRRGMCAAEREEYGAAADFYEIVLRIEEPEDSGPEQAALRIRLRIMAWHRIVEAFVRAGRKDPAQYEEALARAARMEKEYPRCAEDGFPDPLSARFALLERAKALAGLRRYDEAAAEALRIAGLGGPAAAAAREFVCDLAVDAPGAGALPLVWKGEALLREGHAALSIEAFHEALERLRGGSGGDPALALRAWKGVAGAYESRGLHQEAGLALREAEEDVRRRVSAGAAPREAMEEAVSCGFQALQCFRRAWEATGRSSAGLAALCREQEARILERYKDRPETGDLHYVAALSLFKSGEFRKALEECARVPASSKSRGEVLVLSGQAGLAEADRLRRESPAAPDGSAIADCLARAAEALSKALEGAEAASPAPDEARDLEARARYFLARVRAQQGAWKEAAAVLEGFERDFPRRPDLVPKAVLLRLQAAVNTGRAGGVEDSLRELGEAAGSAPDELRGDASRALAEGRRLAGAFFGETADRAPDPEAARAANRKAAALLKLWAEWLAGEASGVRAADAAKGLAAAASRCARAGEWAWAAWCYETLLAKHGATLSAPEGLRARRALGECLLSLRAWARAVEVCREVRREDVSESAADRLALALFRRGEEVDAAGDRRAANLLFDEALDVLGPLLRRKEPQKRAWWERSLISWEVLFRKGMYKEVVDLITNAQLQYKTLGGPDLRPRIEALLEEAKKKR